MSVLTSPLRLATGWGTYPKKLGFLSILMLIVLRVSIGWHFYTEGTSKINSGKFDSSRFLLAAKGPFEAKFHSMIWDHDGQLRLDAEATEKRWTWYRKAIAGHYQFDQAQQAASGRVLKRTLNQYKTVLVDNAADIEEIAFGRQRIRELETRAERRDVTSLRGQKETIKKEWRAKLNPILADIDQAWENLERDLNGLATSEQSASKGHYALPLPGRTGTDSIAMNDIIPWFDCIIGACLLLGLLTPTAALAAGVFLFSVFLSQFPPSTGPGSTYYQLIESMACFVIASTGAGRFAGLDSIIHAALNKSSDNNEKG